MGYRLRRRLLRRRTRRASVEEDFPRAIRLSYLCGSKGADLHSCFIENGTAGESKVASGVCYDALGLPAERCDYWFEEFWATLVLLGIEKLRVIKGFTAGSMFDSYFHPYSHSLITAVIWSAVAAFVTGRSAAGTGAATVSLRP